MKQRYNIMLNPKIVSSIDSICSDNDLSRSEFINSILSDFLLDNGLVNPQPEPSELIQDQTILEDVFKW